MQRQFDTSLTLIVMSFSQFQNTNNYVCHIDLLGLTIQTAMQFTSLVQQYPIGTKYTQSSPPMECVFTKQTTNSFTSNGCQ